MAPLLKNTTIKYRLLVLMKMLPNLLDNSWLTDEEDANIVDDVVPDYSGLMGMLSAVSTDLTGATDVVSMLG